MLSSSPTRNVQYRACPFHSHHVRALGDSDAAPLAEDQPHFHSFVVVVSMSIAHIAPPAAPGASGIARGQRPGSLRFRPIKRIALQPRGRPHMTPALPHRI
jgi:hypothetical protein